MSYNTPYTSVPNERHGESTSPRSDLYLAGCEREQLLGRGDQAKSDKGRPVSLLKNAKAVSD